jgi:hypothetical protein
MVSTGQGDTRGRLAWVEDSHLPTALRGECGSSAELIPRYRLSFLEQQNQKKR